MACLLHAPQLSLFMLVYYTFMLLLLCDHVWYATSVLTDLVYVLMAYFFLFLTYCRSFWLLVANLFYFEFPNNK